MAEYWFEAEVGDVVDNITSVVQSLKSMWEIREWDMRRFASLYRNKGAVGFGVGEWIPAFTDRNLVDRVAYNVVKQCVDTCVSKLTMQKPVPRVLTSGGSWTTSDKAKTMEKLCLGVMKQNDIYRLASDVLRDAAIYGIGFMRVQREGREIVCRRLHPSRIVIDDQACLDGDPSVLFVLMDVPREQLLATFPEEAEMINAARCKYTGTGAQGQAMITYMEAWHTAVGERPGRYVACIDSPVDSNAFGARGLLADEEWEGPIPIIPIRWTPEIMGYWGIGIGEMLEGVQLEIIETLRRIQTNHQLNAAPYLLVPDTCGIPDAFFASNEDGKIIRYTGMQKPELVIPVPINEAVYAHLDRLYARAFEIVGITQLSATGQKPAGLNADVALRTYLNIESQRFAPLSRSWEDMFVKLAKLIVREAARIPGFSVSLADGGKLEKITAADAAMAEEEYELQVWPASSLPLEPTGRIATTVEMMQAGLLDPATAREVLNFPDLERINRLENAAWENFQKTFEYMLQKGEYIEPLPWMDIPMGVKLCVAMWTAAKIDEADEDRLDLLVRWMSEADDMMTAAQEQNQPAQAGPEGAQMAPPVQ